MRRPINAIFMQSFHFEMYLFRQVNDVLKYNQPLNSNNDTSIEFHFKRSANSYPFRYFIANQTKFSLLQID